MINWCPIGRNANKDQRDKWKELDKKYNIRVSILERIRNQALEKVMSMENLDDRQRSMKLLDVMAKAMMEDAKQNSDSEDTTE